MNIPTSAPVDYAGARALVLGATGFIGRWVARALSLNGAETLLAVRDSVAAKLVMNKYTFSADVFQVDLREVKQVRALIQRLRPTIVFNLAAYGVDRNESDIFTAYQINASLLTALCEAMAGMKQEGWAGLDIVHAGSALEYGVIGGDLEEHSIPEPNTSYGRSKLAGTYMLAHGCDTYGLKGTTARLFTVFGPGEHCSRLFPLLMKTAETNELIELTSGTQMRDFTYVRDVAEGLLRLGKMRSKPPMIVNLATGSLSSVRTFVETAAQVLSIPHERLVFGALPFRTEEMQHDKVSVQRLKSLLGWVPKTSLREGIEDSVEFLNLQGSRRLGPDG